MSSHYYCLKVIRLEDLQWEHSNPPDLYVTVKLGGVPRKTAVIKNNTSPTWDESLIFSCDSVDQMAALNIQVQVKRSTWSSNTCVGATDIRPADLLRGSAQGEAFLDLIAPGNKGSKYMGRIVVQFGVIDAIEGAGISLDRTLEDVRRSKIARLEGASDVTQSIDNELARVDDQSDLYQAVGKLLSRIEVIGQVIDQLSEIHPFFTVAWKLASGLYKTVKGVFNTDRRVIGLVHTIVDAFSSVRDVQTITFKAEGLQRSIVALMKQTIECCLFIRHYVSRTFFRRMLDTSSNEKIDEFERSLSNLKQGIESGVTLSTAFVSMRSSQRTDELVLRHRLKPMLSNTFDRPSCLPGTRVEVRSQIMDWIYSETRQNVFWLHGVAGSGKSTICMTIVEEIRDMSRLGAFVFFEREKSDPSTVIASIAYQLASFDSSIESAILSETNDDRDIITGTPSQQFDRLIRRPLSSITESISGPVVIALDAFDECGTPESRRNLMKLIQEEFPKLPYTFRFLATSRREIDIDKFLSSHPENVVAMELDYHSQTSRDDVHSYIRKEMYSAVREVVEVPAEWPWDDNMASLGRAAGGLFIWASTAVKMVKTSDNPFAQLDRITTDSRTLAGLGLDQLYSVVLRGSGILWDNEESRERFVKVLSLLLLSKIPLTTKAVNASWLSGFPPQETSLLVLSRLRSVLSYVPGGPVNLFHASFADYLMAPERGEDPWFIDTTAAKHHIVDRSFIIMKDLLRFNICDVKSSFVLNKDDPELPGRIDARIPLHLEYACLYWPQHLIEVEHSANRVEKLSHFSRHQLLFWFEVLSLKKQFGLIAALLDVASYFEGRDADLSSFLRDARKLASIFAMPIMESVPHIYISMIPLSKDESRVSAHYCKHLYSLVGIERRGVKRAAVCLKVLRHTRPVLSVSRDGRRIASASRDGIQVWDLHSGERILCINHSEVRSVSFFPDGSRLVSGGQTVMVWNAENGDVILGPLKGHSEFVNAVAVSPDGSMFASGSHDKTIIIWDSSDGRILSHLTGHTRIVTSLSFSPDGTRLASGSYDKTVRIWNVNSGEPAIAPLEHTRYVTSVSFSPDGGRVVSGSWGGEVRIWDLEGNVISVLKGHTDCVTCVGYSPCGTRIVSGSNNRTLIVWDVANGEIVSGPFTHDGIVYCVTFSSDGKYIVSASDDCTVRVWDATAGTVTPEKQERHTGGVLYVAIAADGSRFASADSKGSIIIWDALSGDVASGPLLGHSDSVECIAFTPDGSRLISCSRGGKMRIWDGSTGKPVLGPIDVHARRINCIAVSPDGAKVVTGSNDGTIRAWDVATGVLIAGPLHGHSRSVCDKRSVYSLAYSPNGNLLASESLDGTFIIWDTDTWVATSKASIRHTRSVCFSPDSLLLASCSYDGTVLVWDVKSGQVIHGPFKRHSSHVSASVFLLDGLHVVSGSLDGTIRVWNVKTGQTICVLAGHSQAVTSLALSPDGTRLVSGSLDNIVRVWDVSDLGRPGDSNLAASDPSHREDVPDWMLDDDGWMRTLCALDDEDSDDSRDVNSSSDDGSGNLLLWIPPDLRRTLWSPRNTLILNCEFLTKLDFKDAALGDRWSECFRQLKRD